MKQILKLVFLLVIGQTAFAQAPSNYTNINGRYRWIAGMFDSTFHIPKGSTPSLRTGGSTNSGGLFYNTSDSSVYTYTGTQWIKLRGSINPSDTTNKYVTQVYKKSGSDSIFYVKGGVHTWAFNDSTGSPGGGGGGKVYYFNGGVNMGTIGGLQMYELGDTANTGAAANFTRSTTGNIANFITDPNKPGLLQIPAGVWSVDAWLSETGGGANHAEIWVEVEKWDGSTITTIATSPIEQITEGATPNLYSWSVSIPTTSLTVTDRIIIQFYISNTNGKTVTLYTQNGYVGEVHTTFTTGIGAINGLTAPAQYLVTGTSGTDFNINSSTATHTFNLPTASATNRGALSTTDWSTFNNKIGGILVNGYLTKATGTNTIDTSQIYQTNGKIGIGRTNPTAKVDVYDSLGTGIKSTLRTQINTDVALDVKAVGNRGFALIIDQADSVASGTQYQTLFRKSMMPGTGNPANGGGVSWYTQIGNDNNVYRALSVYRARVIDSTGFANSNIQQTSTEFWTRKAGVWDTTLVLNGGNVGINTGQNGIDSALTVANGTWLKRGVRMSALPTGVGTKALRIDANGTLSVADTLTNGVSGSLTANYIPRASGTTSVINSNLYQNSNSIGVNQTDPYGMLSVKGDFTIVNNSWNYGVAGTTMKLKLGSGFGNTYGTIQVATNGDPNGSYGNLILQNEGANVGINTIFAPDSALTVANGVYFQRGVRMSGLPTGTGTKSLRVDANGTLSVADTLSNGVSGSLTANFIPKATGATTLNNSPLSVGSGVVGLGLGVVPPNSWSNYWALQLANGVSLASYNYADIPIGWLGTNAYHDGIGDIRASNGAANKYLQDRGNHKWYVAGYGASGSYISWTQPMILDTLNRLTIGVTTPDSMFKVAQGVHLERGVRMSGLPTGVGTKAVRINANGTLSVADTLANGISGTGTTNYIPKFTSSSAIGNSIANIAGNEFVIQGTTYGAMNVRSASGNANYLFFTEHGVAHRYLLGSPAGSGDLVFKSNSYDFNTGSERMRLTSGGNLGLGTSSPNSKLEVYSSSGYNIIRSTGASGGYFDAYNTSGTRLASFGAESNGDTYIGSRGANPLLFLINGSTAMRLDASGNLGLGVSPSSWDNGYKVLEYTGGNLASYSTSYMELMQNARWNSAYYYVNNGFASEYMQYQGQHRWFTAPSGTAGNAISFTQAMTLDAAGRLGIGTTSPTQLLDIGSNNSTPKSVALRYSSLPNYWASTFDGTDGINTLSININNTSNGSSSWSATDNGNYATSAIQLRTNNTSGGYLTFLTSTSSVAPSERMRITSGGNVLVGSSTDAGYGPLQIGSTSTASTRLQILSSTTGDAAIHFGDATSGTDRYIGYLLYDHSNNLMTFGTNGGERMRLNSSGELLINTTSDAGDYKLQVNGNIYTNSVMTINYDAAGLILNRSAVTAYNGLEYRTNGSSQWFVGMRENLSSNNYIIYNYNGTDAVTVDKSTSAVTLASSIKTGAPSGGTAASWKLGERVASAGVTFNDQQYIQLDIGGTLYYLATVDLPMPEAYPQATSGPSNNYKMAPVQVKTTRDAEIEKLRKEIEELKQLIKNK